MVWLLLLGLVVSDPVTIDRHAPTTQIVTFDLANPPKDLPKLRPGEDAATRMDFDCQVKGKFEGIEKTFRDGEWHVMAKLIGVRVTLKLTNTIYLPEGANEKLRKHEEGHAKLNSQVYDADAEQAARRAAREALAKRWQGAGATADVAGERAYDAAANWLCDRYLHLTPDQAHRIGETYDDLTDHGTNAKPVDEAIREAIAARGGEKR